MIGDSRTTNRAGKLVRDTGTTLLRIDALSVQNALGSDRRVGRLERALAPISLFALRNELAQRLQSSGGRPALTGVAKRAKVPLGDQEWLELEELAAAIAAPGFAPSAGQVASVLLTLSVKALVAEVARTPMASKSRLTQDLAARLAAEPVD